MPSVVEEPSVLEAFCWELLESSQDFLLSSNGLVIIAVTIALAALYVIHQLFVWLNTDPVRSFHFAKILTTYASSGWNTAGTMYNSMNDIVVATLPLRNSIAMHVVQPAVFTAMEVGTLVFFGHHYNGILPSDGAGSFQGHTCEANAIDNTWCGLSQTYADNIGLASETGGNVLHNGTTLVLSTASARRLQQLSGESIIGDIPIQPLIDALEDISAAALVVGAQIADVAAHIIFSILEEAAVLIWNALQIAVKAIGSAVMQIFSSGIVQNLLSLGIDILMVLFVHIALPLLMTALNMLMCLIQYLQPGTWPEEMACVERACFRENGDLGTFALEHAHIVTAPGPSRSLTSPHGPL